MMSIRKDVSYNLIYAYFSFDGCYYCFEFLFIFLNHVTGINGIFWIFWVTDILVDLLNL